MNHLFCFGFGYSARALAGVLIAQGWRVTGTCRTEEKARTLEAEGVTPLLFDGAAPIADLAGRLRTAAHVLVSVPPDEDGDPVMRLHGEDLAAHASHIPWLGYLSTTGVYGDRQGDWVDETSPLTPTTRRGQFRLRAERQWVRAASHRGLPVQIFRLAGIYGPGRNQLCRIRQGTARRIVKPGQVFSRIHVDDIAQVLRSSIRQPAIGRAFNVCDDLAAPPEEVVSFAADLLGLPEPATVAFDDAELSDMARSFYAESKRVRNDRIKRELGVGLLFPTYKEGLRALVDDI